MSAPNEQYLSDSIPAPSERDWIAPSDFISALVEDAERLGLSEEEYAAQLRARREALRPQTAG